MERQQTAALPHTPVDLILSFQSFPTVQQCSFRHEVVIQVHRRMLLLSMIHHLNKMSRLVVLVNVRILKVILIHRIKSMILQKNPSNWLTFSWIFYSSVFSILGPSKDIEKVILLLLNNQLVKKIHWTNRMIKKLSKVEEKKRGNTLLFFLRFFLLLLLFWKKNI